jgi:hypothetical protein
VDEAREALEELGGLLGSVEKVAGEAEGDVNVAEAVGILQALSGGSSKGAVTGAGARANLTMLVQAEQAFRAATGRYGTLQEIAAAFTAMGGDLGDLELEGDHAEAAGFRYTVRLTDAGFEAKASPLVPGSATLIADQTGEIRTAP